MKGDLPAPVRHAFSPVGGIALPVSALIFASDWRCCWRIPFACSSAKFGDAFLEQYVPSDR